jgi:hypothetical protein
VINGDKSNPASEQTARLYTTFPNKPPPDNTAHDRTFEKL